MAGDSRPIKVVVTGASGLVGWHMSARLHARNCSARFAGKAAPFDLVTLDHKSFSDPAKLQAAVSGAEAVFHFAGVNRASDAEVERANPSIAHELISACKATNTDPHIVYANSIHAGAATPYGKSKRIAEDILRAGASRFTNLVLPHVFGECARPFYNNVTATLVHQVLTAVAPTINPDGVVQLLHVGAAADAALWAYESKVCGDVVPPPKPMKVPELWERLKSFDRQYKSNIYPDLADPFDRDLFNSYRSATYPDGWPRPLKLHTDNRGTLFEAVKGGGGGQSFLSTTEPGVTRGDHFHLGKVERFLVVKGEALIRIRKVLSDKVWEYRVNGDAPATVDMPTLHTHSITNVGDTPLLTLFWTHELFDPQNPDTFADKV